MTYANQISRQSSTAQVEESFARRPRTGCRIHDSRLVEMLSDQLDRLRGHWPATSEGSGEVGGRTGWGIGPVRAHRFGHGTESTESATDVEADVLAEVRDRARELHERLAHDHGVYCVEFAGSTGGGKTLLLERLIERAPDDEAIGVIVGDVAGEDDAARLRAHGVQVENVNTGKECHLDPNLVSDALPAFDLETLDTLYLENVGNMVCPADFPLGANRRVLVVSTTEGEDVVRKHPMLVQTADLVVVNKADIAAAVGTDIEQIRADVDSIAPETPVFETDAKHGEGIAALDDHLRSGGVHHTHEHGDHPSHEHSERS